MGAAGDAEVELSRKMRRAVRILLREPVRPWPLPTLSRMVFLDQTVLRDEFAGTLSTAGFAEIVWIDGQRCVRLTELGRRETPELLLSYRSQSLMAILFRDGPRAAAFALEARRRRRRWQVKTDAHSARAGDANSVAMLEWWH